MRNLPNELSRGASIVYVATVCALALAFGYAWLRSLS